MAAVFRLQTNSALRKLLLRPLLPQVRQISTSKKNRDTAITHQECEAKAETKVEKNWVSYGFDLKDKSIDRQATHAIFFGAITLCMVVGGFGYIYMPDFQLRDWAQREAYLELRRREMNGLPLVDPNLVSPSKVVLPDDEELADTEIII